MTERDLNNLNIFFFPNLTRWEAIFCMILCNYNFVSLGCILVFYRTFCFLS